MNHTQDCNCGCDNRRFLNGCAATIHRYAALAMVAVLVRQALAILIATPLLLAGCSSETAPTTAPESPTATTDTSQPSAVPDSAPAVVKPSTPAEHKPTPPAQHAANRPQAAGVKDVSLPTRQPQTVPPTKWRLPDDRPNINEARLQAAGIKVYRSKRLILLTDVADEIVAEIPAYADALYERLESHFGALPAATDNSEFQVTGHLIADETRFQAAGLMPQNGFTFKHGRHLNYQFWFYDSEFPYYRRHLLFHEFTHCFMTCESGMLNIPALWYIEGMAEFFATHKIRESNRIEFGILPEQFEGFDGWGRISEIRRSFQQRSVPPVDASDQLSIPILADVMPNQIINFQQDSQYVTSWALCWLLNAHPQYRQLSSPLKSMRTRAEFGAVAERLRDENQPQLGIDWLLTYESLLEGFDVDRSFPIHRSPAYSLNEIDAETPKTLTLQADRGWQDTGLRLSPGESVRITCSGRYSVNDDPKPWISEPQGVSIEYVRGLPLGQVVATLVADDASSMTNRIPVGRQAVVTAGNACSLWLQVNDLSNSRQNNAGTIDVSLSIPQQGLRP
ncbi:MAG: hypothetical protein WBH28_02145 [Fuerstiella sp.]